MVFGLSLILTLLTPSLESSEDSTILSTAALPYTLTKVVIDAGHGGKDPGCLGKHSREKDIALKIALELGEMIEKNHSDVEVIYTRKTDVFIPLHERARIANRARADLFISIHCNYVARRNQALGTETYIMGLHRADDNLAVAKRENAAILMEDDYVQHYDGYDPESDEGHIILSMYQNAHLEHSILLAHTIEQAFQNKVNRKSRGVKQAGFLVLRNTTMPSVLIETGFLSHDDDEAFLNDETGQIAVAAGIFNAFEEYKNSLEGQTVDEEPVAVSDSDDPEFFVQLAASAKRLDLRQPPWSKYEDISVRQEEDYYKYLAGPYATLDEVRNAREKFIGDGFEGTFIVAFRKNERITLGEATGTNE